MAGAVITVRSVSVAAGPRHVGWHATLGGMRGLLLPFVLLALLAVSCGDAADEESVPTTTETPASTTVTLIEPDDPEPADPEPAELGGPVAVVLHNTVTSNDEVITDNAIAFIGEVGEPTPGASVLDFAGIAGPASDLSRMTAPRTTTGDDWPPGASGSMARTFVDEVLPAFVDDATLDEPLPFNGTDTLFISDVLISGTVVSLTWEIVEHDDDHVVVRVDQEFDHQTLQRGAEATLVGRATGEFRVARRNPLDAVGRIDVTFDLTVGAGVTRPVHQSWEARPLPTIDANTWAGPSDGIERFTEVLVPPPPDPDTWQVAVGYGGRAWSGHATLERTWTQLTRDATPTTVRAGFDLTSNLTPDGQWLTISLSDWTADGPPFEAPPEPGLGPEFALVVAPDGRIGDARPRAAEEIDTRSQRIWFGQVLIETLPALPTDPISVGSSWQARLQGEPDGEGPIYTVVALDGRHLDLQVSGTFGLSIGDRYDGYSVSAEIDGTLRIDRQAAVPLEADITTTGTITFGTAGELDPSTSEPWESTLTLRAIADDE